MDIHVPELEELAVELAILTVGGWDIEINPTSVYFRGCHLIKWSATYINDIKKYRVEKNYEAQFFATAREAAEFTKKILL